jgi:hypothetical protein
MKTSTLVRQRTLAISTSLDTPNTPFYTASFSPLVTTLMTTNSPVRIIFSSCTILYHSAVPTPHAQMYYDDAQYDLYLPRQSRMLDTAQMEWPFCPLVILGLNTLAALPTMKREFLHN